MPQKKFRVVLTKKLPTAGLESLLTNKSMHIVGGMNAFSPSRARLKKMVQGADAILSQLTEKIDGEIMDAAGPGLKIIANYAAGFDNIDIAAAKKRGIIVTNTPGGVSTAVAEHAWVLALGCAKRIVESDAYMRAGKYKQWTPGQMLGLELSGKILGVIGLGRIGQMIATIGNGGFRMPVLYVDRSRNVAFEKKYSAKKVTLTTLIKKADVIIIAVPLLPSTHHLIGAKELASMKSTAILVNIARGPIINEKALLATLKKKRIAAAGLDVFENEPHMTPGLAKLKNIIVTPHTGSATMRARRTMGEQAAQNILCALKNKAVPARIC
ncbi:MAG: D-glycerate dehydrogenase [Patescibacteria group bacterium]|jgi:lactate dehydrogenase-like 2-hydroxyacid dehydrogenase